MTGARVKRALLQVGWIYRLNAALKSRATLRRYRRTLEHYSGRQRRAAGIPRLRPGRGSRPRIFFLGTDEQQDRGGLLQALEKLGDVRWFTRADGSYGQNDPAPPARRPASNARRLREQLQALHHAGWTPDLLIAQSWASTIEPEVLSEARRHWGTIVVNIAMDDRHQYWGSRLKGRWNGTYPLIPHLDLTLTAAPECVEWYEKEGCPALYFPEASDPGIFRPMPGVPKIHDVCFVGGRYGVRAEIVAALRAAGMAVAAYGSGWERGRIAPEDVPRLFAQSRIVLGVGTIGHCRDFYALKMRDFDGPMSASLYLTHDNPDLHALFEPGREIALFRDTADCVDQARRYLAREAERESIAAAGRARAVRDHTWEARFGLVLELLRGDAGAGAITGAAR
jgi:spore maturation protein CgeB